MEAFPASSPGLLGHDTKPLAPHGASLLGLQACSQRLPSAQMLKEDFSQGAMPTDCVALDDKEMSATH